MRNRYKHNIWVIIVIIVLVMNFTGCQLAIKEYDINQNTDTLCGVFVTIGSIDKLLGNQEMSDINITKSINGNFVFNNNDGLLPNDTNIRGYLIDTKHDQGTINKIVKFDGIDGYYMGLHKYVDAEGEKYSVTISDDKFNASHIDTNISDKVEELNIEGTLSAKINYQESIYINPVYLKSDGTYYPVRGFPIPSSVHILSNNMYSQTISSTTTKTEDGDYNSQKVSFKVNIKIVEPVTQIFIREMNYNNELIKVSEYLPESPYEYVVNSNTKYIIVEDIISNDSNDNTINRSLYNIDYNNLDNIFISHPCDFLEDDIILGGKSIHFVK